MKLPLFALGLTLGGWPALADDTCARNINVTGHARSARAPDFAAVTVGVEARAADAAAALDATSRVIQAVLAQSRDLGVAEGDVGTASLALTQATKTVNHPDRTISQEPDGYRAKNKVTIRLANMERLSDLLRHVLSAGANRIESIGFALRDPDKVEAELEADAAQDARMRARAIADTLGVKLGPLCSLATRATQLGRIHDYGSSGKLRSPSPSVPIAAGLVDSQADATATFAIAQ